MSEAGFPGPAMASPPHAAPVIPHPPPPPPAVPQLQEALLQVHPAGMDLGCQALTVCEETQVARLCNEPLGHQTGNEVKISKTKIKQTTKLCRPKDKAQLRRAGWILGLASGSRGEAGRRASWKKRKKPGL